jgi:hypothetical protein
MGAVLDGRVAPSLGDAQWKQLVASLELRAGEVHEQNPLVTLVIEEVPRIEASRALR